ncbi:hypothetical protein IE077_003164 [Cardiosporidium cionae]|uniref:Uncharacterized protein n=1 Tax=Cardiosporidium cionae TaxID=476202 RepID=A0ABQ7J8Z2_9APIC|nr:hypothetical protein IE077_003164 [Cardiosporidium cionae]|eukprot:KAF8820452.1 hypothetical protein IE077_003164 [Cardiosporidium cionae]
MSNNDSPNCVTEKVERSFESMEEILSLLRSTSAKEAFSGILKWSRHPSQWMTDPHFLTPFLDALRPFFLPRLLNCSDPTVQYLALKIITCLLHAYKTQPYKVQLCIPYIVCLIDRLHFNRILVSSSLLPSGEEEASTEETPLSESDSCPISSLPTETLKTAVTPNTSSIQMHSSYTWGCLKSSQESSIFSLGKDSTKSSTACSSIFSGNANKIENAATSVATHEVPFMDSSLTSNTVYLTALECISLALGGSRASIASLNVHIVSPFSRWAAHVDKGDVSEVFLKEIVASLLFYGKENDEGVYLPTLEAVNGNLEEASSDDENEDYFAELLEDLEDFKEEGFELHEAWLEETLGVSASSFSSNPTMDPSLIAENSNRVMAASPPIDSTVAGDNGRILSSSCISLNIPLVLLAKFSADTSFDHLETSILLHTMDILSLLMPHCIKDSDFLMLQCRFLSTIFTHPHLDVAKMHCLVHLGQWINRVGENSIDCLSIFKSKHLTAISKEVSLLLKNRLSNHYRESLLLLIGFLFKYYGFSWITKENEDTLRLFPKLCSVEISLHLHTFSSFGFNQKEIKESLSLLGSTFHVMEIFIGILEENIHILEKPSFPLYYISDIFDGIHNCMEAIFDYMREYSEVIILSKREKEEISIVIAACARLLGRWLYVEPFKYHQEFLEILPHFAKLLPKENWMFIFQSLENYLPSDWYMLEDVLDILIMCFSNPSINVWEEGNGNFSSCYATLLAAVMMDPTCDVFNNSCKNFITWKLEEDVKELSPLYDVHMFPHSYSLRLPDLPATLLQPSHFLPNESEQTLEVFSSLCNIASYVFLQSVAQRISFDIEIQKDCLDDKSKFLWDCGNMCAIAALIGIRSEQSIVLQYMKEAHLLAIWDTLVSYFICLTPHHSPEFLAVSSPSISLWFRLARVIVLSLPYHPYLMAILHLKWRDAGKKENRFFPEISELQHSTFEGNENSLEGDGFDEADHAIVQYFSKLLIY